MIDWQREHERANEAVKEAERALRVAVLAKSLLQAAERTGVMRLARPTRFDVTFRNFASPGVPTTQSIVERRLEPGERYPFSVALSFADRMTV